MFSKDGNDPHLGSGIGWSVISTLYVWRALMLLTMTYSRFASSTALVAALRHLLDDTKTCQRKNVPSAQPAVWMSISLQVLRKRSGSSSDSKRSGLMYWKVPSFSL